MTERSQYEQLLRGLQPLSETDFDAQASWAEPASALASVFGRQLRYVPSKCPLAAGLADLTRCRAAFIRHDPTPFDRPSNIENELAIALRSLGDAWLGLRDGVRVHGLEGLHEQFRQAAMEEAIVDCALLRAAQASFSHEDTAIELARKAAHKAQSSAIVDREMLASVLLARARRLQHKPYLGRWLLDTLLASYPPPWLPWVETERVFLGQVAQPLGGLPATAVVEIYNSVSDPDEARQRLEKAKELDSRFAPELETLEIALGLSEEADLVQRGQIRLGVRDARFDAPAFEILLRPCGRTVRRFPSARLGHERHVDTLQQGERCARGLVALSEHLNRWIPIERWFHATAGFEYKPELHAPSVRATVHRIRSTLPPDMRLERTADTIRLEAPSKDTIIPDPGAFASHEERVLGAIVSGATGSTVIARRLRVSRRTVQSVLRDLVEQGVCHKTTSGRAVEYRVEDTSFFEPSLERFSRVVDAHARPSPNPE